MKLKKLAVTVVIAFFAYMGTVPDAETSAQTGRWVVATAYCSCTKCCGDDAIGLFASGNRVYWGGVAADWRVFPRGTKLEIEGFSIPFHVEDTGRLVKGAHVDIWMPSHRQAEEFGRQRLWASIGRL